MAEDSMSTLAVLILTYNEAENIAACMESAKFADEIVVIDSGSDDATVELAQAQGAKVFIRKMVDGFGGQRNFALLQTSADWVLYLDADERLTAKLAQEIRAKIKLPQPVAYQILRRNILFGQPVSHGGYTPDYSLRLYPREAIRWTGLVHEQAITSLPVENLVNSMFHYTNRTWDKYFVKFNQYTTLMAKKNLEAGKQALFLDILFRPWVAFIRVYILKRGFLDGKLGFVLAVMHFFYTMTKYVKLYDMQRGYEK